MTFQIRPAVATGRKPLIALYGQSGSGKTYSALLLARGLVGTTGKIVMIDTESGRGQLYADVIPGGYDIIDLGEPFAPKRYIEAITAAEQAGADVLIIDSASHEWEGIGGVLDMAAANEQRSGKPGLHCWKQPKMEHAQFVLKLLQTKMPVFICLRAKYKSRQVKNPKTGKSEIIKDEHTTPIQADDFIFETTVHAEIEQDHKLRVTKCSHPKLADIFRSGDLIAVKTGEALAAWAGGGEPPKTEDRPTSEQALRDAAAYGTESLRATWGRVPKAEKEKLKPLLDSLKPEAAGRCPNRRRFR